MELNIEEKLEDVILKQEEKFLDDVTIISFVNASIEFDKLVKSGLVKRRGYNLMTIEGKHLKQFSVNSNFA